MKLKSLAKTIAKNLGNNLSLIEFSQQVKNNFFIIKSAQQKNKNYILADLLIKKKFFIKKGLFFKYNIFNTWGIKFPITAVFDNNFKLFKESLNNLIELDTIIIIKLKNLCFRYSINYKILTFFEETSLYLILQSLLSISFYTFNIKNK